MSSCAADEDYSRGDQREELGPKLLKGCAQISSSGAFAIAIVKHWGKRGEKTKEVVSGARNCMRARTYLRLSSGKPSAACI